MTLFTNPQLRFITDEVKNTHIISIPITLLIIVLAYLYSKRGKKLKPQISLQELAEKLITFNPEPLIPGDEELYMEPTIPNNVVLDINEPVFKNVQNLILHNYLNIIEDEKIKEVATNCIKHNGVGSCGPRGFYGTIDIHLDLECKIAEFMGLEEAVLYSYSVSTMSSAIIAYCKKGDIIFCDEKVYYPSIQGVEAARATIIYFKHNNMKDLEEKLIQFENKEKNKKNKARRFLLVEGIYIQTGKMCPLPELMTLREKYMMRMFLDESISFGTVGKFGRGVTEHFNVDRTDIDLIVGSLEFAIGSIGGFGVGSSFVIEHQRLSGLGYCFSASLPPFLSSIAKYTIDSFEKRPQAFELLENVSGKVHDKLASNNKITVISDAISPKKVITINDKQPKDIVDKCLSRGLLLDTFEDTIYFNIHLDMDDDYISKVCDIINEATE